MYIACVVIIVIQITVVNKRYVIYSVYKLHVRVLKVQLHYFNTINSTWCTRELYTVHLLIFRCLQNFVLYYYIHEHMYMHN